MKELLRKWTKEKNSMFSNQEEWRLDQNKKNEKQNMWTEECEYVWAHVLTN